MHKKERGRGQRGVGKRSKGRWSEVKRRGQSGVAGDASRSQRSLNCRAHRWQGIGARVRWSGMRHICRRRELTVRSGTWRPRTSRNRTAVDWAAPTRPSEGRTRVGGTSAPRWSAAVHAQHLLNGMQEGKSNKENVDWREERSKHWQTKNLQTSVSFMGSKVTVLFLFWSSINKLRVSSFMSRCSFTRKSNWKKVQCRPNNITSSHKHKQ